MMMLNCRLISSQRLVVPNDIEGLRTIGGHGGPSQIPQPALVLIVIVKPVQLLDPFLDLVRDRCSP